MSTRDIITLFSHLLDTQHQRPTGAPEVIPLLLGEYDVDLPLVTELCRHAGAPIVIADGGDEPAVLGVPVATDIDVPGALHQLIETLRWDQSLEIANSEDDRVVVRVVGELIPENPGDRNFLGALAALLHKDLAGQSLGVIAYDHDQMDKEARAALWKLLTVDLPASGGPMPTNLVVCIGGKDDAQYLGPGPSLRFAVRQNTLVRRHAWHVSEREIARLADGSEPIVLFLGAGASFASGLPLGDALRNEALREFLHDKSGAAVPELVRAFFEWVRDNGRLLATEFASNEKIFSDTLTLERVLREVYYEMHGTKVPRVLAEFAVREKAALGSPSKGILALREVMRKRLRVVVVTVNFDRLVEDGMGDCVTVYVTDKEFAKAPKALNSYLATGEGSIPVLKLHGTIDRPETIVVNVEQTALGLSPERSEALAALIGTLDRPTPWIYVGYSMRDPDVLAELAVPRVALGIDERWVAPVIDQNVDRLSFVVFGGDGWLS